MPYWQTGVVVICKKKFDTGAIFQDRDDIIREKRRNSDTSGPCQRIRLDEDAKDGVMLLL